MVKAEDVIKAKRNCHALRQLGDLVHHTPIDGALPAVQGLKRDNLSIRVIQIA